MIAVNGSSFRKAFLMMVGEDLFGLIRDLGSLSNWHVTAEKAMASAPWSPRCT